MQALTEGAERVGVAIGELGLVRDLVMRWAWKRHALVMVQDEKRVIVCPICRSSKRRHGCGIVAAGVFSRD